MRLSNLAETITVTGDAPIVERARTDLSTLITEEQIETLPSNNRNYLDFALLTPSTVENFSTTSQGIGLNVGGARAKEGGAAGGRLLEHRRVLHLSAAQVQPGRDSGVSGRQPRRHRGIRSGDRRHHQRGDQDRRQRLQRIRRTASSGMAGSTRWVRSKSARRGQAGLRSASVSAAVWAARSQGRMFFFGAAERTGQDTPQDNNITAAERRAPRLAGSGRRPPESLPARHVRDGEGQSQP